jgi:hypothetical protein
LVDILDDSADTDDQEDKAEQNGEYTGYPDFELILGAPDFTSLVKRRKTNRSREYERKAASALKTVALGSIQAGNFPDAAAVLWHGPGAATAIGDLADADDRARAAIDMLTSPNSPWLVFAMTVTPLIAQILRNHEKEVREVPAKLNLSRKARAERKAAKTAAETAPPTFTLRLLGRKIPVRLKFRPRFASAFFTGIRSQSHHPDQLTAQVFTDPELLAALDKMGIQLRQKAPDE